MSRYAHAVDHNDVAGVLRCFSATARLEVNGGVDVLEGRVEIATYFARTFEARPAGQGGASTHLLGNVLATVTGDTAHVETDAIACLVFPGRDSVIMRGLRYVDECVREDDWVIALRHHRTIWQAESPGQDR
jgi:hypothetical protein